MQNFFAKTRIFFLNYSHGGRFFGPPCELMGFREHVLRVDSHGGPQKPPPCEYYNLSI